MYMNADVCRYICIYAFIYMYIDIYRNIYINIYIHISTYTYIHIHICVYIFSIMSYIYTHMYIYIYVHVHTYVCIHMHNLSEVKLWQNSGKFHKNSPISAPRHCVLCTESWDPRIFVHKKFIGEFWSKLSVHCALKCTKKWTFQKFSGDFSSKFIHNECTTHNEFWAKISPEFLKNSFFSVHNTQCHCILCTE